MKSAIFFAVVCCLSVAFVAAEVNVHCSKAEDCGADECCLRKLEFMSAKCQKRRTEGQYCVVKDDSDADEEGVYDFTCPCAEGLSCKSAKSKDHDGITSFLDEKCQA